jgi:hypothetical protein
VLTPGGGAAFDSALVERDDLVQTRFKVVTFVGKLPWTVTTDVETPTQTVGLTTPNLDQHTQLLRAEMYITLSDARTRAPASDAKSAPSVGGAIGGIIGFLLFGAAVWFLYKKCCGRSKQTVAVEQQQQPMQQPQNSQADAQRMQQQQLQQQMMMMQQQQR